jgi:hypothetical protein
MVLWAADHPARLRLLDHVEQDLPPSASRLHRDAKRKVFGEFREIIMAGIQSGAFRPVDERIAAFYVIGACNWVAWWYQPGGQHASPDEIADEIADMTVRGICANRDSDTPVGLQGVASRLREDLALLDRIITSG